MRSPIPGGQCPEPPSRKGVCSPIPEDAPARPARASRPSAPGPGGLARNASFPPLRRPRRAPWGAGRAGARAGRNERPRPTPAEAGAPMRAAWGVSRCARCARARDPGVPRRPDGRASIAGLAPRGPDGCESSPLRGGDAPASSKVGAAGSNPGARAASPGRRLPGPVPRPCGDRPRLTRRRTRLPRPCRASPGGSPPGLLFSPKEAA